MEIEQEMSRIAGGLIACLRVKLCKNRKTEMARATS